MAPSDVLGILSLLIAVGAAAYLLRAWLLTRSAPLEAHASLPPQPDLAGAGNHRVSSSPAAPPTTSERPAPPPTTSQRPAPPPTTSERPAPPRAASERPATPRTSQRPAPEAAPVVDHAKLVNEAIAAVEAVSSMPKIKFDEEDPDVEPTKIGTFERQPVRPPVERIVFDEESDVDEPRGESPALGVQASGLVVQAIGQTDPGKRRKQNEDSLLLLENLGVFVVADGMGGHRGGQVASRLAVKVIREAFEGKIFQAAEHENLPTAASELARAIQMANVSILEETTRHPVLKGMGTTLCSIRFTSGNRRMYLGHVGDSRCYRLRDGVMKQMTSDHTMASYGITGPDGAHLSRALGVWPVVPIDVVLATPKVGDVYLLCTDGLTKMLPNQTIATQLLHEEDPKAAVERLVFFANAHGGKDNISVILMRIVESGASPSSSR